MRTRASSLLQCFLVVVAGAAAFMTLTGHGWGWALLALLAWLGLTVIEYRNG